MPRDCGRGRDRGLGSRGCGQGKRRRTTEPNDESGAGPEQPLDSEVHGPHTVYNQTAAGVVTQLQDEASHAQHMPAGLGSGAIGFAEADSVGPGDGDANEDAEDVAQHLTRDNEGDVCRRHALWTRACREQLGRQRKLHGKDTMSMSWLPSLMRPVLANPKKSSSQTLSICSWPRSSTSSRVFCCAVCMSAECPCSMC